jgi:predicted nucleic acid-binding protein
MVIPWPCVHEFPSIVTHPRIYDPPSSLDEAFEQMDAWLESPVAFLITEAEAHWSVLKDLLAVAQIRGPVVHDARVAAICIGNGVTELWTSDRDFSRFPALVTRNPLLR